MVGGGGAVVEANGDVPLDGVSISLTALEIQTGRGL